MCHLPRHQCLLRARRGRPGLGEAFLQAFSDVERICPLRTDCCYSSGTSTPRRRGGIATINDISVPATREGSDGGDDPKEPQNFFAGGERSGISVQDPNSRRGPGQLVNDLLKKASEFVFPSIQ
jgi:hypothetical protein